MHTTLLMVPHWLDSGSHSLVPSVSTLLAPTTLFPSVCLETSSFVHQFPALHPQLLSSTPSASTLERLRKPQSLAIRGWAFPFGCVLLSPASRLLCTHCCCSVGAKYNPPSGSIHVGRAFGDAEASRDMAWPDREKRGTWGHLDGLRTSLSPPTSDSGHLPIAIHRFRPLSRCPQQPLLLLP